MDGSAIDTLQKRMNVMSTHLPILSKEVDAYLKASQGTKARQCVYEGTLTVISCADLCIKGCDLSDSLSEYGLAIQDIDHDAGTALGNALMLAANMIARFEGLRQETVRNMRDQ